VSGSEPNYSARFIGPEIIEAGRANVVTATVYLAGAIVVPTAGTLTVYRADNTAVSAGAVSFAGGVASSTIAALALASLTPEDGWRFEWALTIASVVHTFCRDGSLVYRRLYPVVTDADLLRSHTDLARRMPTTETSYQDYLDEAWARIESRLINSGKRPWLIMSPSALRDIHVYQTLALIFADFATGGTTAAEWETMVHYEGKLADSWGLLTYPQRDPSTGQAQSGPGTRQGGIPTTWAGSRRGSSRFGVT
jgi:hypothetical protein